jgi:uncharacterized membrane protein YvlD (DUF360 family)
MFLGVPVAYLVGILAHMHAIRFGRFLDNRKLLKKAKTRQQALVVFNRIKAFKENKRDRYPFYLICASSAVICAIISSTLVFVCIDLELPLDKRLLLSCFVFMFAVISFVLVAGIYETARQIERFEDYEKEFKERWGTD